MLDCERHRASVLPLSTRSHHRRREKTFGQLLLSYCSDHATLVKPPTSAYFRSSSSEARTNAPTTTIPHREDAQGPPPPRHAVALRQDRPQPPHQDCQDVKYPTASSSACPSSQFVDRGTSPTRQSRSLSCRIAPVCVLHCSRRRLRTVCLDANNEMRTPRCAFARATCSASRSSRGRSVML